MNMKRKLLFVAALVASALGFNANASDNVTGKIQNADLSQKGANWQFANNQYTDWQVIADASHVNVIEFYCGGKYPNGEFKISQSVSLEQGYYHLVINAFYRKGWGGDGTSNAKIFAGENDDAVVRGLQAGELDRYSGNDLQKASSAFYNGEFKNEFDFHLDSATEIEIGLKGENFYDGSGDWCIFGPVTLYKYTVEDYLKLYKEKVAEAEALYESFMSMTVLASLKEAAGKEAELASKEIDDVITATQELAAAIEAANRSITEFVPVAAMKASAEAIAKVDYEETGSGSHDTFEAAIESALETSETASEAIAALRSAVKAYINAAEPKNDGESFDITCLIENPDFANDTKDGWDSDKTPNISYKCLEFYDTTFDINQTLEGLPAGSYSLSVQAFTRPGGNAEAYPAYTKGTNNVHAELYVNNTASKVGNIYSYTGNTTGQKATTPEYWADYECVTDDGSYWVPNGMEGASLYFAEDAYITTVAALVEDDNLKIGFRDKEHTQGQWTILTNFKLYYYGSSKLVYYQQYLPQLQAEVAEDLSNGLYTNVIGKELSGLNAALAAEPSAETEAAYKDVIDAIVEAQKAFRAAYPVYDALAELQESGVEVETREANIGDGAFQVSQAIEETLYDAYEEECDNVRDYEVSEESTAEAIQKVLTAYNEAAAAYANPTLNKPAEGVRYIITSASSVQSGNAVTATLGGISDNNPTGYGFSAANSPIAAYRAQAFIFTSANDEEHPNYYYISIEREEGTVYMTNGTANESAADWAEQQIQGTTDTEKKIAFEVIAPVAGEGLNIRNTGRVSGAEVLLAIEDGGSVYTANGNNSLALTPAEEAEVEVTVKAGKYATVIFPFAPAAEDLEGVTVYAATVEGATVQLAEETDPKANVPYVLGNATEEDVKIEATGFGTATADAYTEGVLTGVYTAEKVPVDSYVLQTQGGVQGFYKVEGDFTATPYRAYLTKDGVEINAFFFGDEATGIESVESAVIAEDTVVYDLTGRVVKTPTRGGIYIVNGVKVVIR